MATTSQSTTEVECPLCGKYRGEPSSVEAHISRKTDEAHKGETGNQHREELQSGGGPSTAESTASSSSESSGSESSSEPELGEPLPVPGPVEEGGASSEESSEEAGEAEGSEPVTIPVPPKPEASDAPESDEETAESEEEEMSLLMLAVVVVGGYLALKYVLGDSGRNQQGQASVPGV